MRYKLFSALFISLLFLLIIPKVQIKASWTKEESNPVVIIEDAENWNNQKIYGQSVIFDSLTNNKLWFSGSNNSRRQIGYADSSSSINWFKYSNPIINWNIISDEDIGVEHPSVLYDPSSLIKYKVWFNNVLNTSPFFKLFYATSSDGNTWNHSELIFNNNESTWDTQGNTAPSIFHDKTLNIYKMWYTGNGVLDNNFRWRIGYATSTDEGVTWDKHPFPVLDSDEAWEEAGGGSGVGNPSVLYENGEYHMFYHADLDIGHAVSYNGIDWTKDPDNPVLSPELTNSQAFDQKRVMDPFVLNDAGTYLMYYTGVRGDGKWQIGLATSSVLPTVIPPPENSPTPTSTPSPTLTPTQTPTPTPTPTQSPTPTPSPSVTQTPTPSLTPTPTPTITSSSVIVIVPGFGASWNTRDIFSCNNNTSGDWKLAPFVSVYKPLMNTLTKNLGLKLNEDVFFYAYDWRRPLTEQSISLKNYLDKILREKSVGTRINFIAHSFGGLVLRSFLSDFPSEASVEKVITVGTPHNGMVLAYPLWEKGEVWSDDKIFKITTTQIINHCRIARNPLRFMTAREVIQQVTPSVKDLLPTFNFLQRGNTPILTSGLKNQNDWLNAHGSISQNYLGSLYTLNGKGYNTLRFLDIKDPSILERKNGDWIDGKPAKKFSVREGDNTILNLSSQFEGANNEIIDGNHQSIISTQFAVNKILSYLGLPESAIIELSIPEITSRNALTISLSLPARLEITDPKRNASSEENIAVIYQPLRGLYRIKIEPLESGKALLHVFYIADGEETRTADFQIRVTKGKPLHYLLPISSFQKSLPQIISLKK